MRVVNIQEARTHLSRLVARAAQGEGFIIAKAGKPMVKVVPLATGEAQGTSSLGFLKGQLKVPDDFDRIGDEEIRRQFEGTADDGGP